MSINGGSDRSAGLGHLWQHAAAAKDLPDTVTQVRRTWTTRRQLRYHVVYDAQGESNQDYRPNGCGHPHHLRFVRRNRHDQRSTWNTGHEFLRHNGNLLATVKR